jgi:hypothetical protein
MEQFVKKSYLVDAVRVTVENIDELASQYDGVVKDATIDGMHAPGSKKYIELVVKRWGLNKKTMAFVGDWIAILGGENIRVYQHRMFKSSFAPAQKDKREALSPILMEFLNRSTSVDIGTDYAKVRRETAEKIEKLFRTPEASG